MSTIKERIEKEQSNTDKIYLHKEGIFYRAYERSAYLWLNHICNYEIKKRYVKTINEVIVYLGFPMSVLENKIGNHTYRVEPDYAVVELGESAKFSDEAYTGWHKQYEVEIETNDCPETKDFKAGTIIDEIMKYPIETSSPIECMMFLSQLKKRCSANGNIY